MKRLKKRIPNHLILVSILAGILSQACIHSRLRRTCDEATNFLENAPFSPDYIYLHAWLAQKYGLDPIKPEGYIQEKTDSLRNAGDDPAAEILLFMERYNRLSDVKHMIAEGQLEDLKDVDVITLPALYCDQLAPDTLEFFGLLREKAASGYYNTTHALLAVLWMEENQCFDKEAVHRLKKGIVKQNEEMLEKLPEQSYDLKVECLALLQAAGPGVDRDQLNEILSWQLENGGWPERAGENVASTHTTVLSLWLMLEYQRRNVFR